VYSPAVPEPIPLGLIEKRRVLYAKGMEKRRAAVAAALVAAGRLAESLEYLERTRDAALLERVRREAVRAGDGFTLSRAAQILKIEPDPSEWRELASHAERAGRYFDAINSLDRAGDAEKAEALRMQHCPGFRPIRPAGK
jgi:hypothetical protein